ncbi:hypothetical protein LTS10_009416 [Elasticomyces elasticus]|nr:hypothetical protein LTS10_009416 [Elasticomyces elasticus]
MSFFTNLKAGKRLSKTRNSHELYSVPYESVEQESDMRTSSVTRPLDLKCEERRSTPSPAQDWPRPRPEAVELLVPAESEAGRALMNPKVLQMLGIRSVVKFDMLPSRAEELRWLLESINSLDCLHEAQDTPGEAEDGRIPQ